MKKLKVEELLDDEVWSWRSFKYMKFEAEVEEIWGWRNLKFKKFEVEEICGWRNLKLEFGAFVSLFGLLVIFGGSG